MRWVLTVVTNTRPWWGLGLIGRERTLRIVSPQGMPLSEVRDYQRQFLDAGVEQATITALTE